MSVEPHNWLKCFPLWLLKQTIGFLAGGAFCPSHDIIRLANYANYTSISNFQRPLARQQLLFLLRSWQHCLVSTILKVSFPHEFWCLNFTNSLEVLFQKIHEFEQLEQSFYNIEHFLLSVFFIVQLEITEEFKPHKQVVSR